MRAHLHLGERAEVLQAYRRLRALLADRLGIEPTAQTDALARDAGLQTPGAGPPAKGPGSDGR